MYMLQQMNLNRVKGEWTKKTEGTKTKQPRKTTRDGKDRTKWDCKKQEKKKTPIQSTGPKTTSKTSSPG